ncbi:ABC transporter permease [Leuconostoc lactis]|uniref:ABC transporter permease n=1 Tax=Leuconostoc lactis TaxID=1246 RepID=UPI001144DE62|nr:ABC transporter permease [Leuconostoc lactis]GEB40933.1 ABC transporter permease [Leuconostoc lactis]GLY45367.1 ABC transporter permease [Leuconostoc lactis]
MPNGLMIVIKQTYRNHFKSRGYWLLVLSPIIFASIIAAIVFGITKMQGNTTPNVAVIGNPAVRQVMIKSEKSLDLKVSRITTQAQANKALDKQTLDGVLTFNANGATLTTQPKSNKINQEAISSVLGNLARTQKAAQYGLTPEQTQALIQPYQLKSVVKQADNRTTNGDNSSMANYGIAVAIGVITMVVVMWYTSMIATEIANEKSSRIMETLLAATSSNIQYFGKIIGIFALTLTHMLLYLVAGIIAYLIFKNNVAVAEIAYNFSGITVGFTVYAVCFILVAVALYLVLTAIIASLVNDNSQVQQAVGPVTVLAMIGYFFSYFMTNMPNNIVIKILSYVPFISQSMMPVRLVTKVESWPAAIVALALSAIALVLLAWFGRGIYAKNVLSYSDDKIMAQLIRNIKHHD